MIFSTNPDEMHVLWDEIH